MSERRVAWTSEAKRLIEKAPRLIRPLIRLRVEAQARRDERKVIDEQFVTALRDKQMGVKKVEEPATAEPVVSGDVSQEARDDIAFLTNLIVLYCENHHPDKKRHLLKRKGRAGESLPAGDFATCDDCRKLLMHGVARRLACPHNPKPSCRNCEEPCHHPDYRRRIAKIMRWGTRTEGQIVSSTTHVRGKLWIRPR